MDRPVALFNFIACQFTGPLLDKCGWSHIMAGINKTEED